MLNRHTGRALYLPAAVPAEQLTAVNWLSIECLLDPSQPFLTSIAENRPCASKGMLEGGKQFSVLLKAEVDGQTSNCKSCIVKEHAVTVPSRHG